jgi:hypothetical protein
MNVRTKQVDIASRRFELRRLPPEVGSFILFRLMGASMRMSAERPAPTKKADAADEASTDEAIKNMTGADRIRALAFAVFSGGMSFDDFKFVQQSCMRAAAVLVERGGQAFPMPLMLDNGDWTPDAEELSGEPGTVNNLVMEVLIHSLASFFETSGQSS